MKQQITHSDPILRFDPARQSWAPHTPAPKPLPSAIRTLSLNILTDCTMEAPLKRNILFSPQRYNYIIDYVSTVQPDVITFNEVTHNFYKLLQGEDWVRSGYWLSAFAWEQADGSFNVLMARVEPIALRRVKVQGLSREVQTAWFRVGIGFLSISCAHLTSLAKHTERRRRQLGQLMHRLRQMEPQMGSPCWHIIQGDLNIHSEAQDTLFPSLQLDDSWVQSHRRHAEQTQQQILQEHPGYTFDSQVNSLIKQVYWGFEARRMRLDRIVHTQGVRCSTMQVVLDKPINHSQEGKQYPTMGYIKAGISLVGDIFGYNVFRQKQRYLFPSDHFGLLAEFNIGRRQKLEEKNQMQ